MKPPRLSILRNRGLACLVALMVCGRGVAADDAPEGSLSVALQPGGGPALEGVHYRFFDEATGSRVGQLNIGSVSMEYRRQGFMRVAWRPLVVLSKVEFELTTGQAWLAQGSQVNRTLLDLGGRDELVLREVRLLTGSPRREITAPTARFLRNGILELPDATVTGSPEDTAAHFTGTVRLYLSGPRAGQLSRGAPLASLSGHQKISPTNVQSPPP